MRILLRIMLAFCCLAVAFVCGLWLYAHRQPSMGAERDTRVRVYPVVGEFEDGDAPNSDDVRLGPVVSASGGDVAGLFDGLLSDRASCGYIWPSFATWTEGDPKYMVRLTSRLGATDVVVARGEPGWEWMKVWRRDRAGKLVLETDRLDLTSNSWSFEQARWNEAFRAALRGHI